jgi:hypothetical protein
MSKATATKITKKMRAAGARYWRIPVTSTNVILIFDSLHFQDLDNPELHDTINWLEVCVTPPKTRYSGDLGKEDKQPKEGIVVRIPQFRFEDIDMGGINTAWSLALKETDELDPAYDVDEIEEALSIRMDTFGNAVIATGGTIVEEYRVRIRVDEGKFGWKDNDDEQCQEELCTLDTIRPNTCPNIPESRREATEKLLAELFDP